MIKFLLQFSSILCVALISGCASTHNLRTDGLSAFGGGFYEEELAGGLYRIVAKSNMSVWPNFAAARSTWGIRADQLCGKDSYASFDVDVIDGRARAFPLVVSPGVVIPAANYNATLSGYILCNSSSLTIQDARNFIREQPIRAKERATEVLLKDLDLLGGGNCAQGQSDLSVENYFHRGKVLYSLERYLEAKTCFLHAQERDVDSFYYKQACEMLGLMYEVGMGVEKNLSTAHGWYRKAGLKPL